MPNPIDPAKEVRDRLQKMAKFVESQLPNKEWGFFILCFPFGGPGGPSPIRSQYVSNARREDIYEAMLEFIGRNIMPNPEDN